MAKKNKNLMIYSIIGIIVVAIIILLLVLTGSNNNSTNSQTGIAAQNLKTVEDIKEAKKSGQYTSEYDKCISESELASKDYERFIVNCESEQIHNSGFGNSREEYIKSLGYADTLDCIDEFTNPICQNVDRYNADVDWSNAESDAYNYCSDELNQPIEIKNRITVMDCMALIK